MNENTFCRCAQRGSSGSTSALIQTVLQNVRLHSAAQSAPCISQAKVNHNENVIKMEQKEADAESPPSPFPIELELDSIRSVCHVVLFALGLPLNSLIAVVIVCFRRLRRKSRYILWLRILMASIFTLFTILLEFVASQWKNETVCKAFVAVTGIGYTWLLFNLLLALIDRYAAIAHSFWYRKNKVTVSRVLIAQLSGLLLIILIIKFPFISGQVPLTCAKVDQQSKIIAILNSILMIACLIGQIVVYTKSKRYFTKTGGRTIITISVSFIANPPSAAQISTTEHHHHQEAAVALQQQQQGISNSNSSGSRDRLRVHGGNRQLEIDATWLLLDGVLSLLLFTLPTLVSGFIEWICSLIYSKQVYIH